MASSWHNLLNGLVTSVPHWVGAILILLVGYFIARGIRTVVRRMVAKSGLDRSVKSAPAASFMQRLVPTPSNSIASLAFWVTLFVALTIAISVLGIPALSAIVVGIYSYIPNIIAAVLILGVATAVAAGVSGLVSRLMGDTPTGKLIASIVPGVILSMAIFMVLNQLKIAPAIVTITYAAILGSVALGAALAFGLGGKDMAAQLLRSAQTKTQEQMGQIKQDMAKGRQRSTQMAAELQQNLQEDQVSFGAGRVAEPSFGESIESYRQTEADSIDPEKL